MYQLPVVMGNDVKVIPSPVMYSLPSYHLADRASDDNDIEITDPVALIELKQADLLGRLIALNKNLDSFLSSKDTNDKKQTKEFPKTTAVQCDGKKESAPSDAPKKDKDAKKEARKAAKNEAKNKVQPTNVEDAKKNGKKSVSNDWIVTEDKPSTETGQSLTSCTKQSLVSFAQETFGNVLLTVQDEDLLWVKAFSTVAQSRHVAFVGINQNNVEKAATTVNVTQGDKFCLTVKNTLITRRSSAWKLLGSALGLFSFGPQQSINATHQQLWLEKAEKLISKEYALDFVVREISKFLSSFDSLGAQFNICAADIVLRSLLTSEYYPNNVELWIGRSDGF